MSEGRTSMRSGSTSRRSVPAPTFPGSAVGVPLKQRRRREVPLPPAALVRHRPAGEAPRAEPPAVLIRPGLADREKGWILVEVMIALTILTVGVLGFMFSFQANFRATREMGYRDLAQAAIESAAERLGAEDFGTLYSTHQGSTFPAPGLTGPDGNPALVRINFEVNEPALAPEYGPVADIDGDGAKATANASASYVMLPTRVSLSYQMSYGIETKILYLLLGPK
jgi:type II secretory pathway pseudopilin PulG